MTLSLRSVLSRKSIPYILAVVLGVGSIVYAFYAGRTTMEQVRLAIRYTARFAFLPFIVTYCTSALVKLWPNPTTAALMRNRFHWGTSYAIAMAIQAMTFAPLMLMPNNGERAFPVFLGTLNYFIIFGMALTPLKAAARAGTLVWVKRYHKLGMHWCWFTFFMQYGFYATHGIRPRLSATLLSICVLMLGLRIASWTKVQIKRYQPMAQAGFGAPIA